MTRRLRLHRPIRLAVATVAALGIGVPTALALSDAPERPRLEPTPAVVTPAAASTGAGEDLSGPCDEAEHANDPTCATAPAADPATPTAAGDDAGDDVSGPCDEAEHANDPRCGGTGATNDDDDRDDGAVEDRDDAVEDRNDDDIDDNDDDIDDNDGAVDDNDDGDRSGHDGGDDRSDSNSGQG